MTASLSSIRDMLLPALWEADVDFVLNYADDSIDIQGINGENRKVLFTREELDKGSYKSTFRKKFDAYLQERVADGSK